MTDLRKYNRPDYPTYITQLYKCPDGAHFRHVRENLHGTKICDAYQRVGGKDVIFARFDLVEVFER